MRAGRQKAVIDFADSTERENWHYIPRERAGLPLKEMDERQRELAHALGSDRSQRVGGTKKSRRSFRWNPYWPN